MRDVLFALAEMNPRDGRGMCKFCDGLIDPDEDGEHKPGCIWVKAQAIVTTDA